MHEGDHSMPTVRRRYSRPRGGRTAPPSSRDSRVGLPVLAMACPLLELLFLLALPPFLSSLFSSFLFVTAQTEDYYCGLDWPHAADNCLHPCPTGRDAECSNALGTDDDYQCFYFTGCWERVQAGEFGGPPTDPPQAAKEEVQLPTLSPSGGPTETVDTNYCGRGYAEASLNCDARESMPCPLGDSDCTAPGESCFTEIDCATPALYLVSELFFTLDGVTSTMGADDEGIFTSTLENVLSKRLGEEGVTLDQTRVTRQELGGSFDYLELAVVITARYRPRIGEGEEGGKNLNLIVTEYIEKQSRVVVLKMKQAAAKIQTIYFVGVSGIGAGTGATSRPTPKPTPRPTGKPTMGEPTRTPTPPPTRVPTERPTEFPSGMPSASPSRSYLQSIVTSTSQDLQALSNAGDTSYGYLFNVRTPPAGPAIILTGLDFYTDTAGPINYELWSRAGSYEDHRGTYMGWHLIASGTVEGQGRGRLTGVPEEDFTPVSVRGDGNQRALYLTLNTKDLIYQSRLSNGDFLGATYRSHASTPELQVIEGAAVLNYPFPDPSQSWFYRAPQEFVGAVRYDRLPCKPFSMYGIVQELPCPVDSFPTASPSSESPTGGPTGPAPTTPPRPTSAPLTEAPVASTALPTSSPEEPTVSLVLSPTAPPTASHAPTVSFPPTDFPTTSPVMPIRVNIVVTLHNVPAGKGTMTRWEADAFIDILAEFLNRCTGGRLVVEGVDLWDQRLFATAVEVEGGVDSVVDTTVTDAQRPSDPTSSQVSRDMLQHEMKERDEFQATPLGVNALQLTLILRISFTTLPLEMIGKMAVATIRENKDNLLEQVRELGGKYMYFVNIVRLDVFIVENLKELASPPLDALVEANATIQTKSGKEVGDGEESAPKFGVVIGAIVGSCWLCLSTVGLLYLKMARSGMTNQKYTETLTKSQQDPINHDPTIIDAQRDSSCTIPSGTDWDLDGSWNDETGRKIRSAKSVFSKSLTVERLKSREPRRTRLNHSDVVTAKERERMLEGDGGGTMALQQMDKSTMSKSTIEKDSNIVKATQDRRKILSRSDSQIDASNRRHLLSRSESQIGFDKSSLAALSEYSQLGEKDFGNVRRLKASLKRSVTSTTRIEMDVKNSFTRTVISGQSNDLGKSINSQQRNNVPRKSSSDMEYEKAMLLEESSRSTDMLDSSLRRRPANSHDNSLQRSNNLQSDKFRKSDENVREFRKGNGSSPSRSLSRQRPSKRPEVDLGDTSSDESSQSTNVHDSSMRRRLTNSHGNSLRGSNNLQSDKFRKSEENVRESRKGNGSAPSRSLSRQRTSKRLDVDLGDTSSDESSQSTNTHDSSLRRRPTNSHVNSLRRSNNLQSDKFRKSEENVRESGKGNRPAPSRSMSRQRTSKRLEVDLGDTSSDESSQSTDVRDSSMRRRPANSHVNSLRRSNNLQSDKFRKPEENVREFGKGNRPAPSRSLSRQRTSKRLEVDLGDTSSDESSQSTDVRDSSMRRRPANSHVNSLRRSNNLQSDKFRKSEENVRESREGNRPAPSRSMSRQRTQRHLTQSMKVPNAHRDLLLHQSALRRSLQVNNEDDLSRKSPSKQDRSVNIRHSGTRKAQKTQARRGSDNDTGQTGEERSSLDKSEKRTHVGNSSEMGHREAAKRRSAGGDRRQLSQSDTTSRTSDEMTTFRKSLAKGSSDSLQSGNLVNRYRPKCTGRRHASGGDSQLLSLSDTAPRTNGHWNLLQKSVAKGSNDSLEKLNRDGRDFAKNTSRRRPGVDDHRTLSKSVVVPRRKGDNTSLQRRSAPDIADTNMHRLVMEAKEQSGDIRPRLRRSKTAYKTNGEIDSLRMFRVRGTSDEISSRQPSRNDSLDASSTSRGEPRRRPNVRPVNFDDRSVQNHPAARRAERHSLNKSMHAGAPRQLAMKGNDNVTDRPQQLSRSRTIKEFASHRGSAKRSNARHEFKGMIV